MEIDEEGRILHCRSGHQALLAEVADSFEGQRLQDIVAPEAVAGCRATLQAASATGYSAGHQFALSLQGRPYWFELSIARKSGPSESIQRFIALSRDITERKQAEARSHHLAYFDALTQLPNRRMLLDRTEQAVAGARKSGQIGALLFVDLDNRANQRRTRPCRGRRHAQGRSRSACWICSAQGTPWPGWGR